LTQSQKTGITVTYTYDDVGQRVKLANGTTTTYYPNQFYNTDGTTAQKHIFANGALIGTIQGTGGSASINFDHTDHLTGTGAVTNGAGGMIQLLDYHPFGTFRIDWKSGSFNEQRKFAGHEYDVDTQLSYMNSRYYSGNIGRFVSQDPMYLAIGSGLRKYNRKLSALLANPQELNSYSYGVNNPLRYTDPTGEAIDWQKVDQYNPLNVLFGEGADNIYYGAVNDNYGQILKGYGQVIGNGALVITSALDLGFAAGEGYNVYNQYRVVNNQKLLPPPIYGAKGNYIPPTAKYSLPQQARSSFEAYEKNGWQKLNGYEGGRTFYNSQDYLPRRPEGYYREFDVNPLQGGVNRGTQRYVTGKGGEIYYSDTHYGDIKTGPAFQRLK
jgi:RHS repeat-associated protein